MIRSGVVGLALIAGAAHAAPGVLNSGGQFSTGGVTTGRALPSTTGNPALLPLTLKETQGFRMSAFELPSIGLEFGSADNFIDDIERLEEQLELAEMGQANPQDIKNEFDPILANLGDAAYVTVDAYLPVPLVPMTFRAFGGVMSVHLDLAASARASLLDAPIDIDVESNEVTTDSALFLRSGQFIRGSLGYGLPLLPGQFLGMKGNLNIGARLHVIQGDMSQVVARIEDESEDESAFDRIEDEFDALTKATTAVGLDVGAAWVTDHVHLGLNLKNLISPSFDVPGVREGCERLNSLDYCSRADVSGLLDEAERLGKFTMDPQATAEAVFTVPGTQLRLASALDLNSIENVGGDEVQNLYMGVIYEGPWYFPSVRLGYQSNLSGNKVDAMTAGINLFGVLNIDALYGLDDVIFEGDKVPRAAAIRIGFAVPFR